METSSFAGPGVSFQSFSGTAGNAPRNMSTDTQSTSRNHSGGLLGGVFGLLGDALASQQRAQTRGGTRRQARQPPSDGLAYGDYAPATASQQPSLISKFADRLMSGSQRSRGSMNRREQSSVPRATRRANSERISRTHAPQQREPTRGNGRNGYEEDTSESEYDDTDSEDSNSSLESQPRRAFTANDADLIEALENAAEHHRREARSCRKRLERASKEPRANTTALQKLLNELKGHENAYENAKSNLNSIKAGAGTSSRRHSYHQARPSQQRRASASTRAASHGSSSNNFGFSFHTRGSSHPAFADLDDFAAFSRFGGPGAFDQFFADPLFDHGPFFGIPRAAFGNGSRSSFSNGHTGFEYQPQPGSTTFSAPPPSPPPSLLRCEEAKRLFKVYNDRWNVLLATDPSIPYPARELKSVALNARDTIWAPSISTPVHSWSEEAVMQANAQAFFLGVVGLSPEYTEAPGTGRVVMGYNKRSASQAQVKQLVDILKKEKMRWHSDRLGRRTGGETTGPNEALQTNERARAVFHAVCELMDFAQ